MDRRKYRSKSPKFDFKKSRLNSKFNSRSPKRSFKWYRKVPKFVQDQVF